VSEKNAHAVPRLSSACDSISQPASECTDAEIGDYGVINLADLSLSGPLLTGLLSGVIARGLPFRFRAAGNSMFPFIRSGDVLSVAPLPPGGPCLGDVTAFRIPGSHLIIHRVIRRGNYGFLLKGDNYPAGQTDGPIPAEDILGWVTRIERNGRAIHLGIGPERRLIAVFSRLNLFVPMVSILVAFINRLKHRQVK
jgi:hypothetical protein